MVQFYPWFKFCFLLFWGIAMYDNDMIMSFKQKKTKFCIRNFTRSLRLLIRFLIRQQSVRKYRKPALSVKYILYRTVYGRFRLEGDKQTLSRSFRLLTWTSWGKSVNTKGKSALKIRVNFQG